jgi:hypothetical protein
VSLVLLAQFIHQMIKVSRCRKRLRPQISLKALANSVADRLAGLVIDQLAHLGTGTFHHGAPFLSCFNLYQVKRSRFGFLLILLKMAKTRS